jgi:hypothetical protein
MPAALALTPSRQGPLPWRLRQPMGLRASRLWGGSWIRDEKMSAGALPGPLQHFLAQVDDLCSGDILDMDQVGRLLVELAAEEEFFDPLIAEMPSATAGGSGWSSPNGVLA